MPGAGDAAFDLAIRPERIAERHLVAGRPPAVRARLVAEARIGHVAERRYDVQGLPFGLGVWLWRGEPAGDGGRLREIAEAALAAEPKELRAADALVH